MTRVTRIGVLVAASGALAVSVPAGSALAAGGADARGAAAGSAGLISGNIVQLPVDVPVNVCGNTVNVAGLLNPAAGNTCANTGGSGGPGGARDGGPGGREGGGPGGASAASGTEDSPGVLTGNGVQLPVDLPVNISGNSVNVVGIGNPVTGNESVNGPGDDRPEPPRHPAPRPEPEPEPEPESSAPPAGEEEPPAHEPELTAPDTATSALARTGADQTLPALLSGTALVLGGAALHRRFRPRARG
ncbi:chaplin [Streptomyces griseoviridis]|uniref:Chaplin domain-containing protein n=1 Tax=Streptomyces griseoviridis TaxID=45398 RepID=A0ABT9LB64_STRGD|nr:chaplin [Streptomyces griseoviridis]MDP9680002.1 hypothetical protein [Streptomyces griseoviridis]GGT04890.1 hypothetical protein GCM10010240_42760 [Streptomyces griseoviridis]